MASLSDSKSFFIFYRYTSQKYIFFFLYFSSGAKKVRKETQGLSETSYEGSCYRYKLPANIQLNITVGIVYRYTSLDSCHIHMYGVV